MSATSTNQARGRATQGCPGTSSSQDSFSLLKVVTYGQIRLAVARWPLITHLVVAKGNASGGKQRGARLLRIHVAGSELRILNNAFRAAFFTSLDGCALSMPASTRAVPGEGARQMVSNNAHCCSSVPTNANVVSSPSGPRAIMRWTRTSTKTKGVARIHKSCSR